MNSVYIHLDVFHTEYMTLSAVPLEVIVKLQKVEQFNVAVYPMEVQETSRWNSLQY